MEGKLYLFILSCLFLITKNQNAIKFRKMYYELDEKINIISGMVNSFKTQIPYDLYYIDICAPEDVSLVPSNLGEILLSGKSYHTGYDLKINQSKVCQKLCSKKISKKSYSRLSKLIKNEYFINYFLDYLPVGLAETKFETHSKTINYNTGIPIGFIKNDEIYINNHYKINVKINEVKINETIQGNKTTSNFSNSSNSNFTTVTRYTIIGFDIEPFSIEMNNSNKCNFSDITQNKKEKQYKPQIFRINEEIEFTYDIFFTFTNTTYIERMDKYYNVDRSIHWTSIIISGIIICILTVILIFIFTRSIKNEAEIQNVKVASEEEINEYGWRNIAFDVFRRPERSDLLASLFGTGIQLLSMILYVLLFVSLGILQPRNGGSYFTLMVMVYIFLSILSGYFSARFYKLVHGIKWIKITVITALLFPFIFFFTLSITNAIYWWEGSTTYVDFKNFISLITLWLIGTVPLLLLGTFVALAQKRIQIPCEINPCPGVIPSDIPWYFRVRFSWIFTAFPSFFSVFVELFYIMDSIWKQNLYALNKYLLISLIVLIITSTEISILFTYVNLCKGDYRWWWKSFFASASPGLYIVIFSVLYLFKMGFTQYSSIVIYLNFMVLLSVIISLICGSSGLFFTFIFLKAIYSRIKLN